jgi:DNA-binding CsgD family transcriptional regulator
VQTLKPVPSPARTSIMHVRLQRLEAAEMTLNALSQGIVLLASESRVTFCNRAAAEMIAAADGLSMRCDRLVAWHAADDAALQQLFRHAVASADGPVVPPDVLVTCPSGHRPLHVTAAPLRQRPAPSVTMTTPVAFVLVTDPDRHQPMAADALKLAYGLTPREASLAAALGEGQSLEETAERLQMSYQTARTHLRRVLAKTGTSRQAALVWLIERIAG